METLPLVEIKNLKTKFGSQTVHDGLSLAVMKEEILGIVGGSGSGKSVLMRFMIGLEPLQQGKLIYRTNPPYPSTQVGVLFQEGALISSLTVLENITIPLVEVARLSVQTAQEIAYIKIGMVGLPPEAARKKPSELSGGMIKRAALARAIALDPEILFLDEPTSGLDPISAAEFDKLVKELKHEFQMTVVMITHDLDSLAQVCDRVAVLVDRKAVSGTLAEITAIDHPWIQDYFFGTRGQYRFKKGIQ
jgi:phospholipid/cholesterol/gamma-HCH transport system ATP-binding protein